MIIGVIHKLVTKQGYVSYIKARVIGYTENLQMSSIFFCSVGTQFFTIRLKIFYHFKMSKCQLSEIQRFTTSKFQYFDGKYGVQGAITGPSISKMLEGPTII